MLSALVSGQGEEQWALIVMLLSGEEDGVLSLSCHCCIIAGQEAEDVLLLSGRG